MARWNSQTTHTDIIDFGDNSELRRELKLRRIKIAALLVAVLAVFGFGTRPAYRAFREHRIEQNLAVAKAAQVQEDWNEARNRARAVLLVRPDLDAYRIWTRALGKLGAPSTYMAVSSIFTHRGATREDLLESLQVMARQTPQALALSAYFSLPTEFRNQASFRAALVPLLIERGQIDLAEATLREVMRPTDEPKVSLELLRALCARPKPQRIAEARGIFAELIARKADPEALDALLLLGGVPGGLAPGDPLPDLPKWLNGQLKATAQHHLSGMIPATMGRPENAEAVYQAAIARFLASDPGVLGTWLIQRGQAALAASTLETPAKTQADACLSRLHALLSLKRTDELLSALGTVPDSCDMVAIELVRARLAIQTGEELSARTAWTRALNAAIYDMSRNRFVDIAREAQALGAKDAAEDAWVAAVCLGWGRLPVYSDLLPVFASLSAKDRSADLLSMFRMLLRFEPLNPELQNNAYYFGLIQGILTPNQVVGAQQQLLQRYDRPVYHSTLMLAEMLDGRPGEALTCLPKFKGGKEVSAMMCTALEGTARVLAGETEAGSALLKKVDWYSFMRQERTVFRDLLVKLALSEIPIPDLKSAAVEPAPEELPAWRKAVERLAKDQAGALLPALPTPKVPGADLPDLPALPTPKVPGGNLPALPTPKVPGTNLPAHPP